MCYVISNLLYSLFSYFCTYISTSEYSSCVIIHDGNAILHCKKNLLFLPLLLCIFTYVLIATVTWNKRILNANLTMQFSFMPIAHWNNEALFCYIQLLACGFAINTPKIDFELLKLICRIHISERTELFHSSKISITGQRYMYMVWFLLF